MVLRMILYFLHMLFIFHPTLGEFPLMCPSKPHWNFRAKHFCQNVDDYRCLWDKNNKKFIEQCEELDIQMKGFRKVKEGDITAGDCTENRYQPRMWTTKGNFDCVLEKSLCNENGQVVYDDGDGVTDRTCGCNSKAGYVFLQKPKNLCYCEPTVEDCTCIKRKCPPEHAVDPEYECRHLQQWKYIFDCKEISHVVTTTVSTVDKIKLTEVPEKVIRYKNKALTGVAIGIVILIFIGIVAIAYIIHKDAENKMKILEQERLVQVKAREAIERDSKEKERQHQEDNKRRSKARRVLERKLMEGQRQNQEQSEAIIDLNKKIALKDNKVVNIKDIGKNESKANAVQIGFSVVKRYTVDMTHIQYMAVSPDGSLWIGDGTSKKVQHIKLIGDSITTMSTFNIEPCSLGISPSGSPLILLNGTSTISIINELTGQIMDSKYSIKLWILTCFHITADNNVIAGGFNGYKGVVIVMDKNGKHLSKYEKDKDAPLLTYPHCIATTRNGTMFIIDGHNSHKSVRLVVITSGSRDVIYYTGNDDITTEDKPFGPVSILVTPNDNVLLVNYDTTYLYIINNEGAFITCFDLASIGIDRPYSLALSPAGNIYVGRANAMNAPKDAKSTLYELEYSGV